MGRRIWMLVIAHLFMGLAVALLKYATLGNDPYSAMMMALTNKTVLSYGTFCLIGNCVFFVIEILFGRQYIGIGTIVNWFVLGYLVMFWTMILEMIAVPPENMLIRVILCVVAIILLGFSLSLYQTADVGSSPFDCLPLIMNDRLHIPFFAGRVICDGTALVVCILAHGILGLGTVLVVIGLGPVAAFFNQHFSKKLLTDYT